MTYHNKHSDTVKALEVELENIKYEFMKDISANKNRMKS